jgi:hypothetical protein
MSGTVSGRQRDGIDRFPTRAAAIATADKMARQARSE